MEEYNWLFNKEELTPLYIHTEDVHNLNAPREVVPVLFDLVKPTSVLDVGCGIGTWLKAFEELKLSDYIGVDGDYVNRTLLKIPQDKFLTRDLRQAWQLNRKFDLVISLEVAEHLEQNHCDHFIDSLLLHGDVIVFSAAIPKQGGQNHVNEQWLSFWKAKFNDKGFLMHDVIRPVIWKNEKIDVWYKQNMVLFCKQGHPLNKSLSVLNSSCIDIIHPDLFNFYRYQAERAELLEKGQLGLKLAFSLFIKALINKLK